MGQWDPFAQKVKTGTLEQLKINVFQLRSRFLYKKVKLSITKMKSNQISTK